MKQITGKGDLLDTAKSAEYLSKNIIDKNTAILGPKILADIYNFDIVAQNLQDENTLAQTAFVDRINALDGFVGATTAAYLAGLTKQYNAFADWLAQTEGIGKEAKPQASGGYAYPGITYQRAEQGTEFVLNNRTTRFAEQAIGGHLTQDRLMASLFGGGGKSSKDTYHFNNMTSDDIAAINANMRMVAREEIQRELR